jgi:hypothetical protein
MPEEIIGYGNRRTVVREIGVYRRKSFTRNGIYNGNLCVVKNRAASKKGVFMDKRRYQ